ncbi:MAG: hypothetical protein JOZ95_00625, partial [Solirubrobacterales bacterium]|nr:hypothetical protein [Solirubrobacterales bacterium]
MSFRPRRALVGLVAAAAALVALPAAALAAGETLSVTPSGTQANSNPSITATLGFAAGDTPKAVVTSLAPGVLSNLNANLSCLAAQQLTPACQIGNATVLSTAGNLAGNLYLVPALGSDAAGIEFVPPAGTLGNQYVGVSLNPGTPGSLNLTTTFPNPSPARITGFIATFNPTLNGQPFTRLPSGC